MTPGQWQRAKDLFLAALDRPAGERADFVREQDGGDPEVRQEVEAMLAGHGETPDTSPPAANPTQTPLTVGPYKLLQPIGEGGMGVVYMAEQQTPVRRRVALKLIKPGMDSAAVIARFEAERQALAMMDHPNIARVFDAAAAENGRPYFVMELVHGVPITRYCDQEQLTPRQRLELFVPVCQAVQHAHQKGIIHRDLKPSNILISIYDGKPMPKIIDFGVAKALHQQLTEKTLFTRFGAAVGTLEYMSPEQTDLDGLGTDTRSDIYSLGVVLYELLTGSTPLDGQKLREAGYEQMLRTIREQEPPKPSTRLGFSGAALASISVLRKTEPQKLIRLVSGDLDWIAMKCLEKDRSRRYETANALARDIERYLSDEPVEASPPSATYKLRKLAHRYRVPLRIATSFAALLVAATVVSSWQAIRATRAKSDAFIANAAAKSAQQQTQLKLAEALVLRGDLSVLASQPDEALADYLEAQGLFRQLGAPTRRAELGLWNLYRQYPPPLNELGAERDLQWWEHSWTQNGRAILCRLEQVPDTLTLRDLADGHEIRSFHQPGLCDSARDQYGLWQVSRDGRKLLAAANGQVMLWDVTSTGPPLHLGAHKGKVFTLAMSADGRRGISGGADKLLKLWDLQNGQPLASIPFAQLRDLSSAVLSPDGQTAAVVGGRATLLSLPDGQIIHEQSSNNGFTVEWTSVKFTDDGSLALLLQSEKLTCFDLKARRIVQTFNADKTDQGGTDWLRFIALCPGGHTAAVLSDHHLTVLDCATGRTIAHRTSAEPYELGPGAEGMPPGAVSPDGHRIVRVGRGHLLLEDLKTGGGSRELRPGVSDVDWSSPDVIAGIDSAGPGSGMLARIWSSAAEPPWIEDAGIESTGLASRCLVFSEDAQLIAGGGEEAVGVWDAHTGHALRRLVDSGQVTSLAFSPEGRSLLVARMKPGTHFQDAGDGTVTEWDLVEGRQTHRSELRSPVLSRDGRRVVSVDARKYPKLEASVREVQSGRELRAFSLPSLPSDQEIPAEWRELLAGDWGAIVSISSERGMLALPLPEEIRLYDLATGRLARTLAAHSDCVAASFSPDGRTLLSGAGSELWIWDVDSGKKLYSLPSRSGTVNSVAWCRDGPTAAFGSAGGRIQVLDFSRHARYRDFAARLEQARRALRANPKDAAALATFGEWYALRGKWDWAAEYLEAARAHGHGISSAVLARCYLAMNNTDAAHREFQQAMQHGEASEPYLRICLAATAAQP